MVIRESKSFKFSNSTCIRSDEKNPKHFKAIFVEAREYYKLGEHTLAEELIENGLRICNELENKELLPHFMILKELNNKTSALSLEKVILEGISYFKRKTMGLRARIH